jgi:4-oxalocrotonate tautomerase
MPHVVVKLLPGRTEQQKAQVAAAIVKDLVTIANATEESVSVAIEEVPEHDWDEKVYRPEILPNRDKLYKKPGYDRPKGRT